MRQRTKEAVITWALIILIALLGVALICGTAAFVLRWYLGPTAAQLVTATVLG